jgi:tRNA threonylcarbamoyladenosine biosynthesis protein TsaB
MYILGMETSTKTGSVAVVSERGVVAQYSLNIEVTHSERLLSTVDRVLSDTGLGMDDLSGLAVAIGPGSFTGLRIGVATVKGLAFAANKPIAAVPTLQALAWNLPHAAYPVCPLLDARKNEVYAALYQYGDRGDLVQLMPEAVIPVSDLPAKITGKTLFTGEAAHLYRGEIARLFGDRAVFAPLAAILPSAAAVAEIGLELIRGGVQADPDSLKPVYIRRPEAEVAWEKRQPSR